MTMGTSRARRSFTRPAPLVALAAALVLAGCGPQLRPDDRALELTGRTFVEFPDRGDTFDLVAGGERTFALWLRYVGGQFHVKILDTQRTANAVGYSVFVNVYSGTLGVWADGGTAVDPSGYTTLGTAGLRQINDSAWHHVALVQRDTLVLGYVDGRLDLELSVSGLLPGMANGNGLWLGWNGFDTVRFTGEVDELSVWNRALSAREIREFMFASPAVGAPGLLAYWPMDETDGEVVRDRGPSGLDGRVHDARWLSSTRPLAPPFRETLWFRVLVGAFAAAALYGLMRLYALRLQRQNVQLERRVAGRTAELEEAHRETAEALTEVEALAGRLAEVDRAKNHFFGNLSHEFRTPLALIIGPLSDLERGHFGSVEPAVRRQVAAALHNGRRLLRLTEQLLDLARLEAGALQLQVYRIDLSALIEGSVLAFGPAAERRGIRLVKELPVEPLSIHGDPQRIEIVLANLLSNALKFTPAGGSVSISAEADDERATVTVQDTGAGIPTDELERIFERFYQTEAGSRQGEGTGIGLALARELVELHGGTLEATSTEGVGTLFTLSLRRGRDHFADARDRVALHDGASPLEPPGRDLPRDERGAEASHAAAGSDEDAERQLVLVVDDNREIRAYVRSHLERTYRVVEAADGLEALERARAGPPDLVVSDLMMPGLDGVELVRALREDPDLSFVPVILLTARAELESRLRGLESGADDYLAKPFEPAELLARIGNLIALRQRLRERLREAAPVPSVETEADSNRLESRLRAVIETHIGDEGFGVPDLARKLAMDRTTLYRRMMEEMGTAPSDFVREVRLARAAELLAIAENSVSEVAYAVGYGSVSSFSRRFADRFGCSPGAYARQARAER